MIIRPLTLATLVSIALPASAAYINPSGFDLGATSYDGWAKASEPETILSSANYAGYGTHGTSNDPWPDAIGSNTVGSGDAWFNKTSGSGYLAGAGAYSPSGAGTFTIHDLTALANLQTIIFQMEVNYRGTGAEFDSTLVTLIIDGTNYSPTHATWFSQEPGTGVVLESNDIYAYQWDLTGVSGIDSFEINWNGPGNGQITSLELVQGANYVQVVPEPSSLACVAFAAGLIGLRRRR